MIDLSTIPVSIKINISTGGDQGTLNLVDGQFRIVETLFGFYLEKYVDYTETRSIEIFRLFRPTKIINKVISSPRWRVVMETNNPEQRKIKWFETFSLAEEAAKLYTEIEKNIPKIHYL